MILVNLKFHWYMPGTVVDAEKPEKYLLGSLTSNNS